MSRRSEPALTPGPRPCIVLPSQGPVSDHRDVLSKAQGLTESDEVGEALLHDDQCSSSRSLSCPRKSKQVHFKELDECLSGLSLRDGNSPRSKARELLPRSLTNAFDGRPMHSPGSDSDELPSGQQEKRLKVSLAADSSPRSKSSPLVPFVRPLETAHFVLRTSKFELPSSPQLLRQSSNFGPDGRMDFLLNRSASRTSCSTPVTEPSTGSVSPLSWASLRDSSTASPVDRVPSEGLAGDKEGDPCRPGLSTGKGKGGLLYERRGRRSPLQLSLKRTRRMRHSRTWTGKREQVLGAEPGTPRLNKCDTL